MTSFFSAMASWMITCTWRGSADYPQAMNYFVFVGEFANRSGGGLRFIENSLDALLRVGIQHEKLAGVHTRVAKQFEAVGFRAGESMFVAENNAGRIFLKPGRRQ